MNKFIKNHFKIFFLISILLIVEVLIVNLPLLNSINYEYSIVNGVLLFFFSIFIARNIFRNKNYNSFTSFFIDEYKLIFLFFIIPLIVGITSTIIQTKCPIELGIKFYFTITFFSFIFGLFINYLTQKVFRKFSVIIFFTISITFLLLSFLEFYFYPQVYSFNPIYGFINGTIYDEEVSINNKILYFQIFSILVFIFMNLSKRFLLRKNFGRVKIFLLWIFIIITSFYLKPYLGFATNEFVIKKNLLSKIETEHFVIVTDTNLTSLQKEQIGLLHEYYFEQVSYKLDVKYKEKIKSFVFKDKIQKGNLLGSSNADIAKPWLNQVYISFDSMEETLKHEIAHVVASQFGTTIFKVAANLNSALTEGLAMFVEDDFYGYQIDYVSSLYLQKKPNVNLKNLFYNSNFFSNYSAISYVLTGSFFNFIAIKYGIKTIKEIYHTGDFYSSTNKNIDVLEKEFFDFIKTKDFSYNKYREQLFFGGKSIVMKFCPRNAAVELKNAKLLFKQKKYFQSLKLYEKIYNYSKSYQALNGIIQSKLMINDFNGALKLLQKEINKFQDDQFYFNLELLLSDCNLLNENIDDAKTLLNKLIEQNPNYSYVNEAKFRLVLIKYLGKDAPFYYRKNNYEKYEILLKIFTKEKNENVLLRLLSISNQFKKDYQQFLDKVQIENNIDGFYTNLSLSKFYFWEANLQLSKKYAIDAVKINVPDEEKYRAIENLRMINWFVNYRNEIKIRTSKNEP